MGDSNPEPLIISLALAENPASSPSMVASALSTPLQVKLQKTFSFDIQYEIYGFLEDVLKTALITGDTNLTFSTYLNS